MAMLGAAAACAQNLYPENLFMPKLEVGSRIYSDRHYSYSGGIELNIPIAGILAVRPNLGGTFFTNKYSRDEINKLDYGLEVALMESKSLPVSFSLLAARELLYTRSEWRSFLSGSEYEAIYGHLRLGADKRFRISRSFSMVPGISNWFLFSNGEVNRVTGFSLSTMHAPGGFFKISYGNIGTDSREDVQHILQASIGVVIRKSEPAF